jgi:SNF2 family DNA or RNA helicase
VSKLFEGLISHNIMEMLEAGNIQGVFTSLYSHEEHTTVIDIFKNKKNKRLDELRAENCSPKVIEKMQVIADQLKKLDERIERYISENNCIICGSVYKNVYVLSCCQNIFCGNCYTCGDCVLCKSSDVKICKLRYSYSGIEFLPKDIGRSKIPTLLDIVGDAIGKKILIFSNYNESFTVIKKFLDERRLGYLELRGTKEKRDNTIDLYKTGNINILLLNTIGSGAGLNLQETTDIIMYHNLHEYQKIQVIGRACRIGRTEPLVVHYLE